jgi:hypothetical protein
MATLLLRLAGHGQEILEHQGSDSQSPYPPSVRKILTPFAVKKPKKSVPAKK